MDFLPVLFGFHASNLGNSHVPMSLCHFWHEMGLATRLYVPSLDEQYRAPWLVAAAHGLKKKILYRFGKKDTLQRAVCRFFEKEEKDAKYVYLWAGLPVEVFSFFHQTGARIIIERINCHKRSSRDILQKTYEKLGLPQFLTISDEDIALEKRKLAFSDAVFCPSPMVRKSMLENGVAEEKLLSTSYGWDPCRFPGRNVEQEKRDSPTFLFVGTLCVRKGIPLLLKAWHEAKIEGRLLLCGGMDDEIQRHFAHLLSFENIRYFPYTKDIGALYREADVFIFPSLEEGGPMVTYEAMAHSLPVLVSEMGAGAIARDREHGFVLPADDLSSWVAALRTMAADRDLRLHLGRQALARAEDFTWQKTAAGRANLLKDKYPSLWR